MKIGADRPVDVVADWCRRARLLAGAGDDKTVRLWQVGSGHPHSQPLIGHDDAVYGVTFSPEGSSSQLCWS
jgi:WD40 repeat protein